jgi:hypothetical protein
MPYFVEGLGDIQEGIGAILSFFKRFQDGMGYAVDLLYRGVFPPKAELVVGYHALLLQYGLESRQEEFPLIFLIALGGG